MFEIPAGARHLLIQEADTTSHHLCESEPKCLNTCETLFFQDGQSSKDQSRIPKLKGLVVWPGPEINSSDGQT